MFLASVRKDVRRMPSAVLARMQSVLRTLAMNPFPHDAKQLRGYDHIYRIRVGDYRIVYDVTTRTGIITIIRIAHRKDVYRNI